METSADEDDVISLEIKSDIQLILSVLCETDMHRKVKLRPEPCFNLKRRHCATFIWSSHLYVILITFLMLRCTAGAVWIRGGRDGCSLPEEGFQQVLQRTGTQQARPHYSRLCVVSSTNEGSNFWTFSSRMLPHSPQCLFLLKKKADKDMRWFQTACPEFPCVPSGRASLAATPQKITFWPKRE